MRRLKSLEGIHVLADAATDDVLLLAGGQWHFTDVKAIRHVDGNCDSHQKWLVTNPPGAEPNTYVLLNVQSGTFAGIWKEEWGRGNHHVKCSPSPLTAANIQWMATPGSPELSGVVFSWLGDLNKVLIRVKETDTVRVGGVQNDHSGHSTKQWRLKQSHFNFETWPAWMSHLPDDIMLHEVNLPTTHQSLANHGISKMRPDLNWNHLGDKQPRPWVELPAFVDNPRCQESSLWDQLQMGIRGFDIRLDLDRVPLLKRVANGHVHEDDQYYIYARHGLAELGYSWSAVLLILRTFLRANPSECVIMNIRYEKSSSNARDRSNDWMKTFVAETSKFWHEDNSVIYKWWREEAQIMNKLPLGAVRGKVILTTDTDYMPADGWDGRRQGVRFYPKNMNAVGKYDSPRDEWDQQLQHCEDNIKAAKMEKNSKRYYQTSFNVTGLPALLKRSSFPDPLCENEATEETGRDWNNDVFDPIDFFSYFEEKWSARGLDCPFSEQSLGRNGLHRIGKIDLDFCDRIQPWIANIVRSNRTVLGKEF